ncbi:MAG: ribosome biogenesis GTPase Der [Armatimonadetes bacterium]|nr:ribosome biogenesis GTPase Der [Armatimonadota bacterium]
MQSLPIVAIVGRPNVGKSVLFNRMTHSKHALVDDMPGVTRDRLYGEGEAFGKTFRLIDTGGLDDAFKDDLSAAAAAQSELAIDEADIIIFLLDGQEGISLVDHEIAERLRLSGKPIVLVANKLESFKKADIDAAWELLLGEPLPISALHGTQVGDLLERLFDLMPAQEEEGEEEDDDSTIKIAVVGRPNVGKSSLVNAILGEERVIVSDISGTTRDAIDTRFERGGQEYMLIDTAGIRRKAKVHQALEYYSVLRAIDAIERCDVTVLVIDAIEGITDQDKRIAGMAEKAGKGLVLVVNKWDQLLAYLDDRRNYERKLDDEMDRRLFRADKRSAPREYAKAMRIELPFCQYAPVIYTNAKLAGGVDKVLEETALVAEHHAFRVGTPELNQLLREVLDAHPQQHHGKRLKVMYATQPRVKPPTFVFFVNDPELVHFSTERFIENRLREVYNFEGTPLRCKFRARREDEDDRRPRGRKR